MRRRDVLVVVASVLLGMTVVAYPAYRIADAAVGTMRAWDNLTQDPPPADAADWRRALALSFATMWLGPQWDGYSVSKLARYGRHLEVGYGDPRCNGSDCRWPANVTTFGDRTEPLAPAARTRQACWSVRRGVPALGCSDAYLVLFTGTVAVAVYLDEDDVAPALDDLRAFDRETSAPLAPPTRLRCDELRHVARLYRVDLPAALHPSTPCP